MERKHIYSTLNVFLFLSLTILGFKAHSTPSQTCFQLLENLKIEAFTGFSFEDEPNRTYLGVGEFGGNVYRVRNPKDGSYYVVKQFHNEEYYKNDQLAFEVLKEIFKRYPHPYFTMIDVLKKTKAKQEMILTWIPGQTLDDVIDEITNPIEALELI